MISKTNPVFNSFVPPKGYQPYLGDDFQRDGVLISSDSKLGRLDPNAQKIMHTLDQTNKLGF
ncbi:MAG: hypothetical protein KAT71_03480 [Gammaproteobacteria bacterium]|nr:hypothetical protein [Gammaproteobacteria bacterium]